MADSPDTYVKIDKDGRYLERQAGPRDIDRINLEALGFVLKGSKGAPKPADGTPATPADSMAAPTSLPEPEQTVTVRAPKV